MMKLFSLLPGPVVIIERPDNRCDVLPVCTAHQRRYHFLTTGFIGVVMSNTKPFTQNNDSIGHRK